MGKNRKSKKSKKRNKSESSTPQSSVPSVEADDQKLLQHGACGSSHSHQSKSPVKSTATQRTVAGKGSHYESLGATSRSVSPEKNRLAVPDQESGAVGSSSPSKKSIFSQLKSKLSPKKRSPNRSIYSECHCESRNNHDTECPEFKLEEDAKQKSPKRPNESKPSSRNVSVDILKERAKSSCDSDPSVEECSDNTPKSEHLLEKNRLAVPEKETVTVSPRSPLKKSLLAQIKVKLSPKKRSPNRSPLGSGCSSVKRNDHELECPVRRQREANTTDASQKNSSRSETSSSSASPISKINRPSDSSKSSSTSGGNVKELPCPNRQCPPLEWPSGISRDKSRNNTPSKNQRGYDPQEGTSRDTAGRTRNRRFRFSIEESLSIIANRFKRIHILKNTSEAEEPVEERLETVIENMGEIYSEEVGMKLEDDQPRKRSISFESHIRISHIESSRAEHHSMTQLEVGNVQDSQRGAEAACSDPSVTSEDPKIRRDYGSDVDTQRGAEAGSSDQSVRRKDRGIRRDYGSDVCVDTQWVAEAGSSDPSVRRKDQRIWRDDESDVDTQRGAEACSSDPSVRRKDRRTRRDDGSDVDTQRGAEAGSSDQSVKRKDPRFRRDDGSDANIPRRSAARRPVSFDIGPNEESLLHRNEIPRGARAATPGQPVRRHQSLSPYPLDACDCGSSYIHVVGCSREKRARFGRKWRRCRQEAMKFYQDGQKS